MQETGVQPLIREDPTCRVKSTKPCVLQLLGLCPRAWELQLLSPRAHNYGSPNAWSLCSTMREAATMRSPHSICIRLGVGIENLRFSFLVCLL